MSFPGADDEQERFRQDAAGAFAHEIRTPLTSLMMAMELARAGAPEGELHFDADLAGLLKSSVESLQELADEFQEGSRLGRGRPVLQTGPARLDEVVARAAEGAPLLTTPGAPSVTVQWDAPRMARALAGIIGGVNRGGDGSGRVRGMVEVQGDVVVMWFESGQPGESAERRPGADAGYRFYSGRLVVLAHGGRVRVQRREGYMRVEIELPLVAA